MLVVPQGEYNPVLLVAPTPAAPQRGWGAPLRLHFRQGPVVPQPQCLLDLYSCRPSSYVWEIHFPSRSLLGRGPFSFEVGRGLPQIGGSLRRRSTVGVVWPLPGCHTFAACRGAAIGRGTVAPRGWLPWGLSRVLLRPPSLV